MLDRDRFNFVIAPFLRDFKPDVVVMQVWGNDVDNTDETVQSLSIASNLEDIATELINDFHVRRIYICEIFERKKPRNISPDHYEKRRSDTMRYLATMVEHERRIRIWRHRRNFESAQEMFL